MRGGENMAESQVALNEEQEVYDSEEQIYKLKRQIFSRKVATFVFAGLSVICLVARLVAL